MRIERDMLGWCSPANHLGLSSRGQGFKSPTEHFLNEVGTNNEAESVSDPERLAVVRFSPPRLPIYPRKSMENHRRRRDNFVTFVEKATNPLLRQFRTWAILPTKRYWGRRGSPNGGASASSKTCVKRSPRTVPSLKRGTSSCSRSATGKFSSNRQNSLRRFRSGIRRKYNPTVGNKQGLKRDNTE